ncbi:hypothetical protein KIN20_001858 [Parelaphostrongylus tenuis]|uniref:Uncharacterized protein n=1 Tax=Parelaphostrongylus tenuis TaxID=148309 RepID=A0AAD5LXL6_PARTN|nr:hypothetical protein KIN20_001858 [Parelaphostrongylus tenuis]
MAERREDPGTEKQRGGALHRPAGPENSQNEPLKSQFGVDSVEIRKTVEGKRPTPRSPTRNRCCSSLKGP